MYVYGKPEVIAGIKEKMKSTAREYAFRQCELGLAIGEDLWHFEKDGKGIAKAIDFLVPYLKSRFPGRIRK